MAVRPASAGGAAAPVAGGGSPFGPLALDTLQASLRVEHLGLYGPGQ